MKKIVFVLALLFFVTNSFSQMPPSGGDSKPYDYLKRSKNHKKVGWILLAGGTAMVVGGLAAFDKSWNRGSNTGTDISGFLLLAGIFADLGSAAFFVSSAQNKRKAAAVGLTNQKILVPHQNSFALKSQPSLTLRIEF